MYPNQSLKSLNFLKQLDWNDVFEILRGYEENIEHWKARWRERGYKSWAEWRMAGVHEMGIDKLIWSLYEVQRPFETIRAWKGGPFPNWLKYYYAPLGKDAGNLPTFTELTTHPGIRNHYVIRSLIDNFPKAITLTAIKTIQGIVVFDGMHRACAMTISHSQGRPVDTTVSVALAEINGNLPQGTV